MIITVIIPSKYNVGRISDATVRINFYICSNFDFNVSLRHQTLTEAISL